MLQVKIRFKFQVYIFLTWVDSLIPVSPSLVSLIIDELGLGDKEKWESTKVKKFKP